MALINHIDIVEVFDLTSRQVAITFLSRDPQRFFVQMHALVPFNLLLSHCLVLAALIQLLPNLVSLPIDLLDDVLHLCLVSFDLASGRVKLSALLAVLTHRLTLAVLGGHPLLQLVPLLLRSTWSKQTHFFLPCYPTFLELRDELQCVFLHLDEAFDAGFATTDAPAIGEEGIELGSRKVLERIALKD